MEAPEDIDFGERENHSEKEKEKEKEKENPSAFVDERATEMELANANVEVRDCEKKISEERKKETRQDIEREKNIHLDFCREEKTEMEAPANNDQVRGSEKKSEERENHAERSKDIPPNEMEKEKKIETLTNAEREQDTPPDDDICPICFDKYNIPCKTNCGHWYCANCIIKVWLYKSLFIPCKCPLCNQAIKKLTHDPSLSLRTENEAVEVLLIIRAYNSLSGGGVRSLILKARLLSRLAPLYFKRFLPYLLPLIFVILILMGIIMVVMLGRFSRGLLNPDKIVANYAIANIIALGLTLCYNYYGFGFLPGGGSYSNVGGGGGGGAAAAMIVEGSGGADMK
ncbi:hypothetical protein Vadar_005853 [Vaccinium darrowii]|uniref:Uncharacterized protein n=1 Tax=Vaccinium darrowii TaxID=229202 RepID=A0ACB7XX53_9ERIC|nr:hypothetical protein Vadar_005853 [Vaccinium darrowii]